MTSLQSVREDRAVIVALRGQAATFRGLANECLTVLATIKPESEHEANDLALLVRRLEAAVDGCLVCPERVLLTNLGTEK